MEVSATDEHRVAQMRQYLRVASSAYLVSFLLVAGGCFHYPSTMMRALLAVLAANLVLAFLAHRAVSTGRLVRSVYLQSAGLWIVSAWTSLSGSTLYPFTALVGIMPVVIAIPHVPPRVLLRLVCLGTGVVAAGSVLVGPGEILPVGVPEQILMPILAAALAVTAGICALSLWQTSVALTKTSAWLEAANLRLRESEDALERKVAERSAELERSRGHVAAARDEALTASRHKSAFLANMSHELRTPLNAIIGFSEVLADKVFGELNDKQTEYIHDVNGSGRGLLALINDILDLSKIEANRVELALDDVDLPSALRRAALAARGRAEREEVAFVEKWDEALGPVVADPRRLEQILEKLLSNALKFTPKGGVVTLGARPRGSEVEIWVADTGIGIREENRERIFEAFHQSGGGAFQAQEGIGLGLALTRRLVELHGGQIWAESEVGRGSAFRFTLKCAHYDEASP